MLGIFVANSFSELAFLTASNTGIFKVFMIFSAFFIVSPLISKPFAKYKMSFCSVVFHPIKESIMNVSGYLEFRPYSPSKHKGV